MKAEEKQLLLKDLSGRLPYGVIVRYQNKDTAENFNQILDSVAYHMVELFPVYDGFRMSIIPYLRPLSSMTKEEILEFSKIEGIDVIAGTEKVTSATLSVDVIDWLLSHHFDYRGLIKKGLALEAPKGMYKE